MQFLKKDPSDVQFGHEVIPAILVRTFAELKDRISRVEGRVRTAQIDVMDGVFVPNYTWPYESHASALDDGSSAGDIDDLDKLETKLALEIHLMVVNPEEQLHEWLIHGEVKRVLIHPESTQKLETCLDIVRDAKREVGLALHLETPLEVLTHIMDRVSHVQLMGIAKTGFGGQPFDERVIPRVRKLRAMYPHCTIAVDGGISRETGPRVIAAGGDVLVAGSVLFSSPNIEETLTQLRNGAPTRR